MYLVYIICNILIYGYVNYIYVWNKMYIIIWKWGYVSVIVKLNDIVLINDILYYCIRGLSFDY